MAETPKIVFSLQQLYDKYSMFGPDQVLTHGQLNSLPNYLDGQERLARTGLMGVGVVNGLHVSQRDGMIVVGRGLGLTTDGDLLRVPQEQVFDTSIGYTTEASRYDPFFLKKTGGPEQLMPLDELIPKGTDVSGAKKLADVAGRVVILLVESAYHDPSLCISTDCDNLGIDVHHKLRFLLAKPEDAQALVLRGAPLVPTSMRARSLPAVWIDRPSFASDVTTATALAASFRVAAGAGVKRLQTAFAALGKEFAPELQTLLDGNPTGEWSTLLAKQAKDLDATASSQYVLRNYLKDLADTFNEAREALLCDDSVPLPDPAAFPKHLLLGSVGKPRVLRTGLFPSPLDSRTREHHVLARFLLWKLHVMLHAFALPTDTQLRITPSRGEQASLQDRAIPWHYKVSGDPPINVVWNYRLAAREQGASNLGYRAGDWQGDEHALTPLQFGIAAHDFFRVEGHLGQPVKDVVPALRAQIANGNLPLQVQAVLVHTKSDAVVVRPPVRYTELHALHYLVRQDVALRLSDGKALSEQFSTDVTTAVSKNQIPDTGDSNNSIKAVVDDMRSKVTDAHAQITPLLAKTSLSAYRVEKPAITEPFSKAASAVSTARGSLGQVSRVDYASAFDSLLSTNQPHWIDWIDKLITAGDARADDKLLFGNFVKRHPGVDALGGCWRGGTLVLAYDDAGKIVADFALPYPCAEVEEPEPQQPKLDPPPFRPPIDLTRPPIRLIPPIDTLIKNQVVDVRETLKKDLEVQKASIDGIFKGVQFTRGDVKLPAGVSPLTADPALNDALRGVEDRRMLVENLRDTLSQPGIPDTVRTEAQKVLVVAEKDLGASVADVSKRVVERNEDANAPATVEAGRVLAGGAAAIRDTGVANSLKTQIGKLTTDQTLDVRKSAAGFLNGKITGGLRN